MNKFKKTILMISIAVVAVACSSTPTTDSESEVRPDATPQNNTPREQVDIGSVPEGPFAHLDPNDTSNPENLKNPNSVLSRRVIYFDLDQSTIRSEYRPVVAAHAALLASNPQMSVVLEGHADERGTREYNLGLGERRGNSGSRAMDAAGAAAKQISVVSYGEERPALTCGDESCWSQNRRVEIIYR